MRWIRVQAPAGFADQVIAEIKRRHVALIAFQRALIGAAFIGRTYDDYLACVRMDGRVVPAEKLAKTQVDGWPK